MLQRPWADVAEQIMDRIWLPSRAPPNWYDGGPKTEAKHNTDFSD